MGISYQIQPDVITCYRVQATHGVLAANDATARRFRTNTGPGMSLTKAPIIPGEVKSNLLSTRPRHGPRNVSGNLTSDLSLTAFDPLFEAMCRGTFSATLTSASFTMGYVAATGVLTRSAGSFIGELLKVGDVIVPAGAGAGVNVGVPGIVVAVGTTTLTIGNKSSWVDITAGAGVTVTRPKKVIDGVPPVLRDFSIEHFEAGAANSERYIDCRLHTFAFAQPPEGDVTLDVGFTGLDRLLGTTRYFGAATEYTSPPMAAVDAIVCYNGSQVLNLSACSLSGNLQVQAPFVVGAAVSPNAFDGVKQIAAQLTFLKTGQSNISAFQNETGPFSLQIMYKEVGTQGFTCVNIPAFTLGSATASQRIGASGAQLEVVDLLIGEASGTDKDPTMMSICTSAT